MKNLEFTVSESLASTVSRTILDTLDQLNLEYEYEELSPSDAYGICTYRVLGVMESVVSAEDMANEIEMERKRLKKEATQRKNQADNK